MLKPLINLFFPKTCFACGDSIEGKLKHVCIRCRHELPRVNAHLFPENPIKKIFWGRVELEKAASFIKFQKGGRIQNLMHAFKYRGVKELGVTLGEMAALEIKETSFFNDIDVIIPIPIHKLKEKKRGYNQSQYIADGLGNITEIAINKTAVIKEVNTQSQTRKSRFKRWENVGSTFKVIAPNELQDKHILLVDDVVTTGATIEAVANELTKIKGVRLSLLTIAATF